MCVADTCTVTFTADCQKKPRYRFNLSAISGLRDRGKEAYVHNEILLISVKTPQMNVEDMLDKMS